MVALDKKIRAKSGIQNTASEFFPTGSARRNFVPSRLRGEDRFLFMDRGIDAYGNTLVFTGPGADGRWFTDDDVQSDYGANNVIYCGYSYDAESQLYYVRNRTFNPSLGRWIQRDPIGYAGGISLYGYAGSAPAGALDPQGLDSLGCDYTGRGRVTEKPYVPNAIVRGLAFLLRHAEHNPIDWRWWDYGLFTCECELACVICAQGYGVDAVYNMWWGVYTTRAKKSATAILDLDRAALEAGYEFLIGNLSHSTGGDLIAQTISGVEDDIIEIGVGNMTRGACLRAAAKIAFQKQVSGLDKKCKTYCKAQKKIGAEVNIGL